MVDFYTLFPYIEQNDRPSALATIIHVEGSAYRKGGAKMLILENGEQIGTISGGCLETDVIEQARAVMKKNEPCMITYDLRSEDDLGWGSGNGCNGSITLLVEPVTTEMKKSLVAIKSILDNQKPVISITHLINQRRSCHTSYYTADGLVEGKEPSGIRSSHLQKHFNQTLASRQGCLLTRSLDGDEFYFFHYIAPKPRLFIFGAGKDARFLTTLAAKTGFSVFLLDWREAYCNWDFFPDATDCIVKHPSELVSSVSFHPDDSVVIMTHQYQHDHLLLEQLIKLPINYLGILGPRARTVRLLGTTLFPSHLYSPVGLSIGAEGPEEIAISIVAEIIQSRKKNLQKQWS